MLNRQPEKVQQAGWPQTSYETLLLLKKCSNWHRSPAFYNWLVFFLHSKDSVYSQSCKHPCLGWLHLNWDWRSLCPRYRNIEPPVLPSPCQSPSLYLNYCFLKKQNFQKTESSNGRLQIYQLFIWTYLESNMNKTFAFLSPDVNSR